MRPKNEDTGATMKVLFASIMSLIFFVPALAQTADREISVRRAVEAFYAAYHDGFEGSNEFAADDWNHINPMGGWTRGRENVLTEVRNVHSTFLKDATDTVEEMAVRFASRDVAVATVISRSSTYITPDGLNHENERNIRTFVVVKRGGKWLVMQDQNTVVRP